MTLYEKLHTANKEDLAEFLALSYGMYVSQNNELFNNDPVLGFMSYTGFGMHDAIKNHILKELDKELEDLELVKKFKSGIEMNKEEPKGGGEPNIINGATNNDSYIDPQIENFVNNFGWD